MANTRSCNPNAENNDAEINNAANPTPTLEQVLAMLAQMLQTMQQNHLAPQPQQRDKLGEFQRTKPLTFSHSVEPMDANDWPKTIEKKLQVVQCNNREKVLVASHQLIGPASDW
jgi:pullulanase/glycogen debranching enzyme